MKQSEAIRLKKLLAVKFGWVCWYCGMDITNREKHLDHIVPYSKSKDDSLDNLALSCAYCNYAKQDCDLGEFYSWLEHIANRPFRPKIKINGSHPLSNLWQDNPNE